MIDSTKKSVPAEYSSLDKFVNAWNEAERKQVIVEEMENRGVFFDDLKEIIGKKDLDPFDIILHIVFDKPALTRKERANNVKKRNYFTKYGEKAREILDLILTKYCDAGLEDLESVDILKLDPIKQYGTQIYIINKIFGGIENYQNAIREMKNCLYAVA